MLQKEVAERLVASSGNKIYGITTIAVNLVGNSKILFDVSPHCFYPQPKVKSAVVKIVFDNTISNKEYQAVMEIVKIAFNQRRKQLRNSLKHFLNLKMGDRAQEFINNYESKKLKFFDKRPEMLTYKDFIELYKEINNFVLNG
jgi:16S rRNA (adenine1518-N6/adenine1519-N6)-dimethyltransferase